MEVPTVSKVKVEVLEVPTVSEVEMFYVEPLCEPIEKRVNKIP